MKLPSGTFTPASPGVSNFQSFMPPDSTILMAPEATATSGKPKTRILILGGGFAGVR